MYWMISANEKKYNYRSAFEKWGYIDWKTYANYSIGDIVYVYCSKTSRKVMYKTKVEKTDIPYSDKTDDTKFWINKDDIDVSQKFTRLRLIRTVDRDELSLDNIRKIGIKNGPEKAIKLSDEIVDYLEKYFSVGDDEEKIISFPCSETYDLVRKTHIHAHPAERNPKLEKIPRYLMVRGKGGVSHELFQIERTIEFNPLDANELNHYKSCEFYDNLRRYIVERANTKFGFESAPASYRYYILKKVYSLQPAFTVKKNNSKYRFLTFGDIGIDLPTVDKNDIHDLYLRYYKQEENNIPLALANAAKAHRSFITKYPKERIMNLSLDEYLIAKEGYGNPDSFCRKIRFDIDVMGHMGNVRFNIFGVYYRDGNELVLSDMLRNMFDSDIEKAFEFQKREIVKLLSLFENKKYNEIQNIKLNSSFKYRLLMVYYPNEIIPVCTRETLNGYCDSIGIHYNDSDELIYRNLALVDYKNTIDELAGLTNFEAMRFFDWLWRRGLVIESGIDSTCYINKSNKERAITKISSDEIEASEADEYIIKQCIDNADYDDSYEEDIKYDAIPEPRIEVDNTTEPSSYYSYPRDLKKRINALRRAKFVCEFDPNHKSFISKKNNMPYMETHHLVPLEYWKSFKYSLDVEANIVCLCSNCHNEIHYGKYADELIRPLYEKRKDELHSAGIDIDIDSLVEMYEGDFVKDK